MMELKLSSSQLTFQTRSLVQEHGVEYGLAHTLDGLKLAVFTQPGSDEINKFEGEASEFDRGTLLLCPLSQHNAAILRHCLPWLTPQLIGIRTSAGMGDRLGLATPGHVRALRSSQAKIAPIFAQQSIREMRRTARTPQQVIDDATWGIFEEGWQNGIGADADHLKTNEDIDVCYAAGFTFFTFDPGQYVDDHVDIMSLPQLEAKISALPPDLQLNASGLLGKSFDIEGHRVTFSKEVLYKSVAKYCKAVLHVVSMYEHIKKISGPRPFEVEISMDETEHPTSPEEHIYITCELRRFGVEWVSFAPRFVGRFEKGVDYIGDITAFESQLALHAAIARQFGPYKLSLHSGSDKFSIYQAFMHHTCGSAHLKTAGTSYLEALRTIAVLDPQLFKEIYIFACQHFEADRQSYHISASLNRAPKPDNVRDWTALLDQFDAREILHVTFGSVLTARIDESDYQFHDKLMDLLIAHRELYFTNLEKHFKRHLELFTVKDAPGRESR
jgi:tagaturonate epimerase